MSSRPCRSIVLAVAVVTATIGGYVGLAVLPERPAGAATVRVTAADRSFSPETARVLITEGEPGFPEPHAHVVWTMGDAEEHTITFDDPSLPSSGPLGQGRIHEAVLTRAGSFGYRCLIHPGMTGTVVVIAPAPTTTTAAPTTTTTAAAPTQPAPTTPPAVPATTTPTTRAPATSVTTTTTRPGPATTAAPATTPTAAPTPGAPDPLGSPGQPTDGAAPPPDPSTVPSALASATTTTAVLGRQAAAAESAADRSSGAGVALVLAVLVLAGGATLVLVRRTKKSGP